MGRYPNSQAARTQRMASEIEPLYISVAEAELMSGVSRFTWRSYCYRGIVESAKVGKGRNARLLIPIAEVKRILRESTRPRVDGRRAGEPAAKPEEARA